MESHIIFVKNADLGHSTGEGPDSVAGMARHIQAFVHLLGPKEISLRLQ